MSSPSDCATSLSATAPSACSLCTRSIAFCDTARSDSAFCASAWIRPTFGDDSSTSACPLRTRSPGLTRIATARPSIGDATRCVWSSSKLTRPGSDTDVAPDASCTVSILMKSWGGVVRVVADEVARLLALRAALGLAVPLGSSRRRTPPATGPPRPRTRPAISDSRSWLSYGVRDVDGRLAKVVERAQVLRLRRRDTCAAPRAARSARSRPRGTTSRPRAGRSRPARACRPCPTCRRRPGHVAARRTFEHRAAASWRARRGARPRRPRARSRSRSRSPSLSARRCSSRARPMLAWLRSNSGSGSDSDSPSVFGLSPDVVKALCV